MMKATNGTGKPDTIKFPVKFQLKAIFDNTIPKDDHIYQLKLLLKNLKIKHGIFSDKLSSNGKYISIGVPVEVKTKKIFDQLYIDLKQIPGIKYAL